MTKAVSNRETCFIKAVLSLRENFIYKIPEGRQCSFFLLLRNLAYLSIVRLCNDDFVTLGLQGTKFVFDEKRHTVQIAYCYESRR